MGEAAVAVANACGYVNAGTVEFLVDREDRFYFLEVNARLQVEHTITEEIFGLDLVAAQLRIAAGEAMGFGQADLQARGHAIQCRINAEDPGRDFAPTPGSIHRYREPAGLGVRVDSGYGPGDAVPDAYDSLIAKLVVWAPTREEARRRMLRALDEFVVDGVATTIPAHRMLLQQPDFEDGSYSTVTVEQAGLEGLAPVGGSAPEAVLLVQGRPVRLWHPAMAEQAAGSTGASGDSGAVVAPMHGTVLKILVAKGERIEVGDPVAVLEAMKMETAVLAPSTGAVEEVHVKEGDVVASGDLLAEVDRAEPDE
jgi:acetyl-CoA/propionyl-CoA carboxylase biotin carboxyl carrier protein